MADNMSPEEIEALLNSMNGGDNSGGDGNPPEAPVGGSENGGDEEQSLTPMDLDILGEVYNVSMGAAAGAVSSLLRMKVDITTPQVTILKEADLAFKSLEPAVGVEINYVIGVQGVNVFILSQFDVMKLVDMWLGGTGQVDENSEFSEMHMSAIGELMNQMMGQSSMALAGLLNTVIDISAPETYKIEGDYTLAKRAPETQIVVTKFKFVVGDNIIDSELITTCDIGFAKGMINMAKVSFGLSDGSNAAVQGIVQDLTAEQAPPPQVASQPEPQPQVQQPQATPPPQQQPEPQPPTQQQLNTNAYQQPPQGYYQQAAPQQQTAHQYQAPPPQYQAQAPRSDQPVTFQPVTFGNFDDLNGDLNGGYTGNLNLIRRVPLEISAEIGRARVPVREVLDYGEGYLIEFDRQAGEPIDIFANGVLIAKGTVIVIEENLGVRITEIISPDELVRIAEIN